MSHQDLGIQGVTAALPIGNNYDQKPSISGENHIISIFSEYGRIKHSEPSSDSVRVHWQYEQDRSSHFVGKGTSTVSKFTQSLRKDYTRCSRSLEIATKPRCALEKSKTSILCWTASRELTTRPPHPLTELHSLATYSIPRLESSRPGPTKVRKLEPLHAPPMMQRTYVFMDTAIDPAPSVRGRISRV